MTFTGRVIRMGGGVRNAYSISVGMCQGKRTSVRPRIGGKIILKLKLKNSYTRRRLDSRTGIDGGRRKHETGTLFSKKVTKQTSDH